MLPRYRMLVDRTCACGALSVVAALLMGLTCGAPSGTHSFSGCDWVRNDAGQQLGLTVDIQEPAVCPVRVNPNASVLKQYTADVLYNGNALSSGQAMHLTFKDARGFPLQQYTVFFMLKGAQNNQPLLEASTFGVYLPANAGFQGNRVDTAVNAVQVQGQTAELRVLLPYLAETPPALQGPVSIVWGDPVTYQVDGSVLRRGVLVRWMVNGVTTYSDTIKVSERYSWHAPVWATAGIHKLTIVSISATGRYDSLTKVVTVTVPPGCDGGGSIPVRAEPTDSSPVIPRAPVHNSCPP